MYNSFNVIFFQLHHISSSLLSSLTSLIKNHICDYHHGIRANMIQFAHFFPLVILDLLHSKQIKYNQIVLFGLISNYFVSAFFFWRCFQSISGKLVWDLPQLILQLSLLWLLQFIFEVSILFWGWQFKGLFWGSKVSGKNLGVINGDFE